MDEFQPLMSDHDTLNDIQRPSPSNDSEEGGLSRLQRFGIILFGFATFFLFLILKLPEARIQNLVIAHLRILAQDQGMAFSAEKVKVGILLGPAVKLYNVELKALDNDKQSLKIPFLKVSPQLLSLISKTKTVSISAEIMEGDISGTVGASPTSMVTNLSVDSIDLGSTKLLRKFIPVDLSGKINGKVKLDIDMEQIQKSDGSIKLKIDKLNMPAQAVMGFNLPKINVNESNIEITINAGQIQFRAFDVGKDTKQDDVVAHITGDGMLDRYLDRSRINAKASFELSTSVVQSFPLLDALLGPAKMPDGKFSYRLNGPISALDAQPGA